MILSLNEHKRIERTKAPNIGACCNGRMFGIAPRFRFEHERNNPKNPGSFGFRFVMQMGSIVFGSEPKSSMSSTS